MPVVADAVDAASGDLAVQAAAVIRRFRILTATRMNAAAAVSGALAITVANTVRATVASLSMPLRAPGQRTIPLLGRIEDCRTGNRVVHIQVLQSRGAGGAPFWCFSSTRFQSSAESDWLVR